MQITFDPPLRSTITIPVYRVVGLGNDNGSPATLTFSATLSRDDYDRLKGQAAQIQVWSNLPSKERDWFEWGAHSFASSMEDSATDSTIEFTNSSTLSLCRIMGSSDSAPLNSDIVLKAHFEIPSAIFESVSEEQSFQYTYRIVYSGGIWWQGDGESSNGTLRLIPKHVSLLEQKEPWNDSADGSKSLIVDLSESVGSTSFGTLGSGLTWTGWVMSDDGPITFELPTRSPLKSSFIYLLPSYPTNKYLIQKSKAPRSILHTTPGAWILFDSDGSLTLGTSTDSQLKQFQVFHRIIFPDLLTDLFKLAEEVVYSGGDSSSRSNRRVVLPQSSPDHVAFLSTYLEESLVWKVDIMPLQPLLGPRKSSFDTNKIYEALDINKSTLLVAFCEETGLGTLLNLPKSFQDGSTGSEKEFRVVIPGHVKGGSLTLAPLLSPRSVMKEESTEKHWSIAPLSAFVNSPTHRVVKNNKGAPTNQTSSSAKAFTPPSSSHSNSDGMIASSSRPGLMVTSMAYIALLITVLLSYITSSTPTTARAHPPSSASLENHDKVSESIGTSFKESHDEDVSLEEVDSDDKGDEDERAVVLDLSQIREGDKCRLIVNCSLEEMKDLCFELDGKEVEHPLKQVGPGEKLWLMEVERSVERSQLFFKVRS